MNQYEYRCKCGHIINPLNKSDGYYEEYDFNSGHFDYYFCGFCKREYKIKTDVKMEVSCEKKQR
jgi:hypothetical protein